MSSVNNPKLKKEAKVAPARSESPNTDLVAEEHTNFLEDGFYMIKNSVKTGISKIDPQWVRRIVRICFIFLIFILLGVSVYVYFFITYLDDTLTLSGNSVEVKVRNCVINLVQKSSVPDGEVEVKISAFDKDSLESSDNSVEVKNPWADVYACTVDLAVDQKFPETQIICENACRIEQEHQEFEFSGTLKVKSEISDDEEHTEGRLKLKKVKCSEIDIQFEGTVTIESLETTSGGTFSVTNGDLWVQTEQDSKLTWSTNESGAYCLAGKNLVTSTPASCQSGTLEITNSTTYNYKDCQGVSSICNSEFCSAKDYSVSVKQGGIYWNRNSEGALPEDYELIQGDTSLALNINSRITIEEIRNKYLDLDIRKDILVVMNYPGINEEEGKWLFTTNIAYAQLKPRWLGMVSFSVLVPEIITMSIRMVPSFCPMVGPRVSEEELGQIWNVIYEEYGKDELYEVIWMERNDKTDEWYSFYINENAEYKTRLVELKDNIFLLLALVISCFLGLVGGVGGAFGAYFALKYMIRHYFETMEHSKRYKKCRTTVEQRNKVENLEGTFLEEEEEEPVDPFLQEDDQENNQYDIMPSPYALPDLFIMQMRKNNVNSLSYFLKLITYQINVSSDTPTQTIKLVDLKELYETFCFVNQYKEYYIKDYRDLFMDYQIEFFTLNDITTEVFRKIRLKSNREILEQGKTYQMPTEDSLSYFVRARCKLTAFESDTILLKDLHHEYEKFARAEKVSDPIPVTKRALENLGCIFERMQVTALRANGEYRIDMKKAQKLTLKPMEAILAPKWFYFDFIAVVLHLVMTLWLIIPLSLNIVLTEAMNSEVSARDPAEILTFTDLKYNWWNIYGKVGDMPTIFIVCIIISFCIAGIGVLLLMSYYLFQKFPIKIENVMAAMPGIRSIPRKMFYGLSLFVLGIICTQVVIGLCWYILGAVLNPDINLPDAAAAITFISFVMTQIKNIRTLRDEIFRKVKQAVWDKLRGLMVNTVDEIVTGIELNKDQFNLITEENRILDLFARTPLGEIAEKIGIDHKLAAALTQGEDAALGAIAEKFGVHHLIVEAVIATIKGDNQKLIEIVGQISEIPGVGIKPELAQMIVKLAWKQSDLNISSAVKSATIIYKDHKNELLGEAAGKVNIDPRIVEALVAMTRGSTGKILKFIEDTDEIPNTISDLLKIIKGLISPEVDSTEIFIDIMNKYLGLDINTAKGIGIFCNETFGSKHQEQLSGFDNCLENILQAIKFEESVPIHFLIHVVRDARGEALRLIPQLVEFLNTKHSWRIDPEIIRSLLIAANGVVIDLERLSGKYMLNQQILKSISPLFSEKKLTDVRSIGIEQAKQQAFKSLMGLDLDSSGIDLLSLENIPPGLKSWIESQQPTEETMEWMSGYFGLTGEQLLGVYAILRGGNESHEAALRSISAELLRRMQIDERFTDHLSNIVIWATSYDEKSIKKAQNNLSMHMCGFTFVAKGLQDPKDLPKAYLKKLGIATEDPLIQGMRGLSWSSKPSLCREWCKAVALKISENRALPKEIRVMVRGQLLLASQYPQLYIKQLLLTKFQCDEESQRKIKFLLNISFLNRMTETRREETLLNFASLFEAEINMIKAWVNVVTQDDQEEKLESLKVWLDKIGIEEENIQSLVRFLKDYCDQERIYFQSILGFEKLSKTIGLPKSFINSLTDTMFESLKSQPKNYKQFLKGFCRELGVENVALQESIVAFLTGELDQLEPLGTALGLKPHSLTALLDIFGSTSKESIIEKFGEVLDIMGISGELYNSSKTLMALCLRSNSKFKVRRPTGPANVTTADMVQEITGINHFITKGMIAAINKDIQGMSNTIIEMAKLKVQGFRIEESHCRGIISMALGRVANVEDICTTIKFDPDIAEILVKLSGGENVNSTFLKSSSNFQKLALKLGLDQVKTAGVLALTREDLKNVETIALELDENGSIHPEFLRALVGSFKYSYHNSKWPLDYDPREKTESMLRSMQWLCRTLGFKNPLCATVVMRLIQGDAGAMDKIFSRLGWSGLERSYYSSLSCLVNPVPFQYFLSDEEKHLWTYYKHLPSVVSNLSELFKVNPKALNLIIKLAREEEVSLSWGRNVLELKTNRETIKFLKEFIEGHELESEEEEEIEEDQVQENNIDEIETFSNFSDEDSGDHLDFELASEDLVTKKDPQEKQDKIERLLSQLNSKCREYETKFDSEKLRFFLSLAQGKLDLLGNLRKYLNEANPDGLPISILAAMEIIILSSGKLEDLEKLNEEAPYGLDPTETISEDQKNLESSFLNHFGLSPNDPELHFFLKLGKGDHKCWDIGNTSSKIHQNKDLVKAFTALCSKSPEGIIETLPALSEYLDLNNKLVTSLVMISVNAVNLLPKGIISLTNRLEVDSSVAGAFIPNCYKTNEALQSALQPVCERLSVNPTSPALVSGIFEAIRGNVSAWIKLGSYFHRVNDQTTAQDNEIVLCMLGIEQLLKGTMFTQLRESMLLEADENILEEVGDDYVGYGDLELVPVQSISTKQRLVILQRFGFGQYLNNPVIRRLLQPEFRSKSAEVMLDLIVGISKRDVDAAPLVLRIIGYDKKQDDVLKALQILFLGNSSMIAKAANTIEEHIQSENLEMPSGVIQTLVGAIQKYPLVMIQGINRAAQSEAQKSSWVKSYDTGIPNLLLSIIAGKFELELSYHQEVLQKFITKLTNTESATNQEVFTALLLLLMGKADKVTKLLANNLGFDEQAIKEIICICSQKNAFDMKDFPCITERVAKLFPQVPPEVWRAIMILLGNQEEDLDGGRHGMGETLHTVMKYVINKLPKESRLSGAGMLGGEFKIDESSEIKILDAFFLVSTDPFKYKGAVLKAIPDLGRALIPQIDKATLDFLEGLVSLYQSEKDPSVREKAILKIASAFEIEQSIVTGLISLSKGDWSGLAEMAGRFCEFDSEKIQKLVHVAKTLKIFGDFEETNSSAQKKSNFERLKEKIDEGGNEDQIFHMLDQDGSGYLDFEEFSEVMKFFDLKFSQERLLEIFSKYDADGTAVMNVQEFENAVNYIKSQISLGALDNLGLSRKRLFSIFIVSVCILLFLFAFIFLGIRGFISASQFGTVVNSMLPVTSGGILAKLRSPGSIQAKIDEIKDKIIQALNVLTINDI